RRTATLGKLVHSSGMGQGGNLSTRGAWSIGQPALLPGGLNNTWEWLEKDWTLITIRQAGHFVQHDAAGLVTRNILNWLAL
ncbi:MAG: hypothetical protein WBZ36_27400, partial [Candidatus Nitrosopolaris sp.]